MLENIQRQVTMAFAHGGGISTCGADSSASSNGVSTSGGKVTTQNETLFPMLMTFPAVVML